RHQRGEVSGRRQQRRPDRKEVGQVPARSRARREELGVDRDAGVDGGLVLVREVEVVVDEQAVLPGVVAHAVALDHRLEGRPDHHHRDHRAGGQPALGYMTLWRRGASVRPGMRPRLVRGLPSTSLMSAVNPIGGAAAISIPTPKESTGALASTNAWMRSMVMPPLTKIPTLGKPARSSRARTSFTSSTVTRPRSKG